MAKSQKEMPVLLSCPMTLWTQQLAEGRNGSLHYQGLGMPGFDFTDGEDPEERKQRQREGNGPSGG